MYVPDSNLASELNRGNPAEDADGCVREHRSSVQATRAKLRSETGRAIYGLRRGLVEPVFGVLKEQRNGRRLHRLPAPEIHFSGSRKDILVENPPTQWFFLRAPFHPSLIRSALGRQSLRDDTKTRPSRSVVTTDSKVPPITVLG
jgi:hypothetical protein